MKIQSPDKRRKRPIQKTPTVQSDVLHKLLTQSAILLQGLAQAIAVPDRTGGNSGIVDYDPVSGKRYLKLPLPEPSVVMTILEQLTSILGVKSLGQKS